MPVMIVQCDGNTEKIDWIEHDGVLVTSPRQVFREGHSFLKSTMSYLVLQTFRKRRFSRDQSSR